MQTFAIHDPIISPIEREGAFCIIEDIATENSGMDVPSATAVVPMIRGESLKRALSFLAELTKKFAENASPMRLIVNTR